MTHVHGDVIKGGLFMNEKNMTKNVEDEVVTTKNDIEHSVDETNVEQPTLNPFKNGSVTKCDKLNVRKNPSIYADIICVIDKGTKLTIDESKSKADWFKVTLNSGKFGYCMKEYITVE